METCRISSYSKGPALANPDDISVAAIFPDDSLGQSIAVPTTMTATHGMGQHRRDNRSGAPQSGQKVAGICWDITDLKDTNGDQLILFDGY